MARKKGKELDSRTALLDAAWQLLLDHGGSGLSVEAIVTRATLSKGTFFHFFPTKQDFLDALCARAADLSWEHAGGVLQRTDLDPVARLDLFFQESRAWRSTRSKAVGGLWRDLARPENEGLMRRIEALNIERLAPILASLVAEANTLGLMRVTDVEVTARLVAEWVSATVQGSLRHIAERNVSDAIDLALRRANATIEAMERILGLRERSLTRVDPRIIASVAAGVSRDEPAANAAPEPPGAPRPDHRHDGPDAAPIRERARARKGGSRHVARKPGRGRERRTD